MITYRSKYSIEDTRVLRNTKLDLELSKIEIEYLIDKLLNIDKSDVSIGKFKIINKDLDYLESLLDNLKDNTCSIKLKVKITDNRLLTEPLSVNSLKFLENKNIVCFDVTSVYKALAFKHLHYEFGYDILKIEDELKDITLLVRNSSDKIMRIVDKHIDNLELLRDFEITDNSYICNNVMYDSFCNKVIVEDNTYNLVLSSTFKIASLLVLIDISEQLVDLGIKYKPLGIDDNKAYFILDKSLDKKLTLEIILDIFNRYFSFEIEAKELGDT